MISKYRVGTITPEIIQGNPYTWAVHWLHKAQKAEREGNELVILEVSKNELIELLKLDFDFGLEQYLNLDTG